MKLVKMHAKEQRAFDSFVKQQLNAVGVDTSQSDTYFTMMKLPSGESPPDAPATKKKSSLKSPVIQFAMTVFFFIGLQYMLHDRSSAPADYKTDRDKYSSDSAMTGISAVIVSKKEPGNRNADILILFPDYKNKEEERVKKITTPPAIPDERPALLKGSTVWESGNDPPDINSARNNKYDSLARMPTLSKSKEKEIKDSVYIIW